MISVFHSSRYPTPRGLIAPPLLLRLVAIASSFGLCLCATGAEKPNVLFIVIDDQNDWVGPLGGHPLAKTPSLDRLAARGTVFLSAHCQGALCNSSRTSVMLSLRPTTTGIYGLAPRFRDLDKWRDRVSLPQYFHEHGYRTATTGKVYHSLRPQQLAFEFDDIGPGGGASPRPPKKLIPPTPNGNNRLVDWGTFPHRDEDKTDYHVASWAVEKLKAAPMDKPLFLAVGFSLPHVPCYATQRWLDLYPDDDSVLPPVLENDRADTPRFSWYLHWSLPEPRLTWLKKNDQWRNLARSYLACTSFVDSQIGRLLDALKRSGNAERTIVVVWSDHGWHLGEKGITGKTTLWERTTRVPLIFAGPGIAQNARCNETVELLDIYPTLVALCGLPERNDLDGHSLIPQLRDANAPRELPAITSHNQGNDTVRTKRWRYIRYADGSEELYDMQNDPHEWTNVVNVKANASVIAEHRKWLPKVDAPAAPGSAGRVLTYNPATDEAVWENKTTIHRGDPIPE
jgi:choline-sulfatase